MLLLRNSACDFVYFDANDRVVFGDVACVRLQGPDDVAAFFMSAMCD